jgi:hypothetical protein
MTRGAAQQGVREEEVGKWRERRGAVMAQTFRRDEATASGGGRRRVLTKRMGQ